MKKVKFYVAQKGPVMIPENQTKVVYKKTKRRKVKMLTAKGPDGQKLWKIIG